MRQAITGLLAGTLLAAAGAATAQDPEAPVRFAISRFEVAGNSLLPDDAVTRTVAPFAGPERDFGDVQRALEALETLYREHGYTLVTVQLPEQELNGGVVRLLVLQPRLGQVTVGGNRHVSEENVRRALPALVPGQTPHMPRLSANLRLANENPARKLRVGLENGAGDDEIDAQVTVEDSRPWKAMLTADNTGTEGTGKTHLGVLLQHANLWGRDHVASLQYTTTAEHPDQVAVWGAGYHIPLYALGDSLDLYASYSNVDSGAVSAGLFNLAVSGRGAVYGARYNQLLARRGEVESRLAYGIDYKAYKNSVLFAGEDFGNDVTVRPLSVSYALSAPLAAGEANLAVTALHNLAGGPRGGSADFARARSGAKAGFNALRLSGALVKALGQWQGRLLFNGQWSADALVPGEQFGAGGAASVRGFDERALATDRGATVNGELFTPELCGGRWQCRLLGFYDTAWGSRNHALAGELTSTSIASAGVGLRLGVGSALSVQIDYGHVLRRGELAAGERNKLHLRVGLAY